MRPLSVELPVPSAARLAADLRALEAFTRPERPWTRRAFSDEDRAARGWLASRMAEAGLLVGVDAAANVIGCYRGRSAGPPLAIGSHLDTVEEGGRFDGIAGVLAGLEVARCLREGGHRLGRALEVINFTCEEPSDFGLSTIGSRAMSGRLDAATAARLTNGGGRTLAEAIDGLGGRAASLEGARRAPGALAGYLELHIEQSASLDRARIPVGVVTAIAAPTRFRVAVRGRADHAGGTSMAERRDALAAAAEAILAVERTAREIGRGMVGTVGAIAARPNMVNIVPGEVELLADFRGIDAVAIQETVARFEAATAGIGARRGVEVTLTPLLREMPQEVPSDVVAHAAAAAEALGVPYRRLTSGASHDANHLARLCPIGLVFIRCRGGRSHCPDEWAEPADLAVGTRVLLELVLRLDRALSGS